MKATLSYFVQIFAYLCEVWASLCRVQHPHHSVFITGLKYAPISFMTVCAAHTCTLKRGGLVKRLDFNMTRMERSSAYNGI